MLLWARWLRFCGVAAALRNVHFRTSLVLSLNGVLLSPNAPRPRYLAPVKAIDLPTEGDDTFEVSTVLGEVDVIREVAAVEASRDVKSMNSTAASKPPSSHSVRSRALPGSRPPWPCDVSGTS